MTNSSCISNNYGSAGGRKDPEIMDMSRVSEEGLVRTRDAQEPTLAFPLPLLSFVI